MSGVYRYEEEVFGSEKSKRRTWRRRVRGGGGGGGVPVGGFDGQVSFHSPRRHQDCLTTRKKKGEEKEEKKGRKEKKRSKGGKKDVGYRIYSKSRGFYFSQAEEVVKEVQGNHLRKILIWGGD